MGEHLKDQLIALDQIEEGFDQSNIEIHHQITSSFDRLQTDLNSHQYNINTEKKQFEKEKELIKRKCTQKIKRKYQQFIRGSKISGRKSKCFYYQQTNKTLIIFYKQIKLNVGGQLFETSLTTLRKDPNSKLAQMFSEDSNVKPDADNSYFIDRDSTYFRLVLNYLRDLRVSI